MTNLLTGYLPMSIHHGLAVDGSIISSIVSMHDVLTVRNPHWNHTALLGTYMHLDPRSNRSLQLLPIRPRWHGHLFTCCTPSWHLLNLDPLGMQADSDPT